jgi:hypothetical protein
MRSISTQKGRSKRHVESSIPYATLLGACGSFPASPSGGDDAGMDGAATPSVDGSVVPTMDAGPVEEPDAGIGADIEPQGCVDSFFESLDSPGSLMGDVSPMQTPCSFPGMWLSCRLTNAATNAFSVFQQAAVSKPVARFVSYTFVLESLGGAASNTETNVAISQLQDPSAPSAMVMATRAANQALVSLRLVNGDTPMPPTNERWQIALGREHTMRVLLSGKIAVAQLDRQPSYSLTLPTSSSMYAINQLGLFGKFGPVEDATIRYRNLRAKTCP